MKRIRKKRKELFDIAKWSAWAHWYPGCPDPCNGVATQRSERLCMRHSVVRNICQGEYTKMSNGDIGYQLRQRFCTCQYGITPPNGIRLSKTTIILKRQKRVIGNFTSWADLHNEEATFLCLNGKKIIGKFDGDDFKDMICLRHNSIQLFSGTELGIQHGYSLDKDLEFCNTNQHTLLHDAADINGDGIDDVACIDRNSGQIQILTLVENRIVIRADWAGLQDFCVGDDLILAAQLVYSDVRPDLVCVDSVKRSETFAVNNWNL
uniref:Uncharacterized protein n=1 Tax=Ciona savignyi TaxID=51511 RepID=H2YK95_CIOSA